MQCKVFHFYFLSAPVILNCVGEKDEPDNGKTELPDGNCKLRVGPDGVTVKVHVQHFEIVTSHFPAKCQYMYMYFRYK